MIRSKAITEAARGHECTMNSPKCNYNPETVVAAHSNWQMHGKGMGQKAHDLFTAFCCSSCHHWLDTSGADKDERLWYWYAAHAKTLVSLVESGVITIKGHKP